MLGHHIIHSWSSLSLELFWRNRLWNSSNGLISLFNPLWAQSHWPPSPIFHFAYKRPAEVETGSLAVPWRIASWPPSHSCFVLATSPKALWFRFCSQLVWVSITLPGGAEFRNHLIINRKTNSKPTLCLHSAFQMTQKIFYLCNALFKFLTSTKRKVSQQGMAALGKCTVAHGSQRVRHYWATFTHTQAASVIGHRFVFLLSIFLFFLS